MLKYVIYSKYNNNDIIALFKCEKKKAMLNLAKVIISVIRQIAGVLIFGDGVNLLATDKDISSNVGVSGVADVNQSVEEVWYSDIEGGKY